MRLVLFAAIATISLLLTACSGDEGETTTPSEMMAPEMETSGFASGVIDHTRDEQEFEIRKSLYGVEDLIEHYEKEGYDTAELEAKKAQLEKELAAFSE